MTTTRRETLALIGASAAALLTSGAGTAAFAQDATPTIHEIKMLNKATDDPKTIMVFEPNLIRAKIGDKIKFLATDKGHAANSIKDLIPAGAEPFKSAINEEFEYEFTADGAYAIQCTPHLTMGMVMLVLVGDVSGNLEAVKAGKYRGKAKDRFAEIFTAADALLAAEPAAG